MFPRSCSTQSCLWDTPGSLPPRNSGVGGGGVASHHQLIRVWARGGSCHLPAFRVGLGPSSRLGSAQHHPPARPWPALTTPALRGGGPAPGPLAAGRPAPSPAGRCHRESEKRWTASVKTGTRRRVRPGGAQQSQPAGQVEPCGSSSESGRLPPPAHSRAACSARPARRQSSAPHSNGCNQTPAELHCM